MDPEREARLEALKLGSYSQLLIKCARLVNERGLAIARQRLGLPQLRATHMALLPHIPLDGVRQTELARAMGVSKQAVGQLVGELVDSGFLELVQDPADRRAKLVRYSGDGEDALFEGLAVLAEVEETLTSAIGEARAAELHAVLLELHDALAPSVVRDAARLPDGKPG